MRHVTRHTSANVICTEADMVAEMVRDAVHSLKLCTCHMKLVFAMTLQHEVKGVKDKAIRGLLSFVEEERRRDFHMTRV